MTLALQIFISYKRENQPFAEELRETLITWGYGTWLDIINIPKGAYWPDEIDAGLQRSEVVIGVMSPEAVQSRNVKNEWDWAIINGKRLILLMLEQCYVPMNYVSINYIDFTKDRKRGLDQLKAALETRTDAPTSVDPYRPYLEALYERINTYLAQKIVPTLRDDEDRPEPIHLRSEATPNAVLFEKRQEIDPLFAIGGIETGKTTEPQQIYDDFERAFKYYEGRVLLLGEPGAGKTITLLHFGRDAVVRRIQDPSLPLPILLIVPTWDVEKHNTFGDWVSQSYGAPEHAAQIIERGEALLLLDGLDELGSERPVDPNKPDGEKYDPRPMFMNLIPASNQVLMTCRVKAYEDIGEKITLKGAVTLKPLDDAQIRAYLAKQPELMAAIAADESLREMLSTPLLLSFFAFAYHGMTEVERQQLSDLNNSPGDLRDAIFRKFVEERYKHERLKLNLESNFKMEWFYEVIGFIALRNSVFSDLEPNISVKEYAQHFTSPDQLIYYIKWANKLDIMVSDEDTRFRFGHFLIREYFALAYTFKHLIDKQFYTSFSLQFFEPTVYLSKIEDERAFQALINVLKDYEVHEVIRSSAAYALGMKADPRAVESLLIALFDDSSLVQLGAVCAFGWLHDKRAIKPLMYLLPDHNLYREWRDNPASVLGKLGDLRSVDPLIAALLNDGEEDGHYEMRESAAHALGNLGDLRAVEPLIDALFEDGWISYYAIAGALGDLGDIRAVEPLIDLLKDDDPITRFCAASSLGKLGDVRAVEPLITALSDTDKQVVVDVINALRNIGTPEALAAVEQWQREQEEQDNLNGSDT
jgi:HEAT repeat protein